MNLEEIRKEYQNEAYEKAAKMVESFNRFKGASTIEVIAEAVRSLKDGH